MLVQQCHSSIISYDFMDYSWLRLGLGVGKWSRLYFWIKMLFQGQQYMLGPRDTSNSAKSGRASVWVLTPQCSDGTLYCKKHRPLDETLNRGPDSPWSFKIPGCPSKKSKGVTQASWPNFPIGLWPSWPPNHPNTLIGFITLSPLHQ